ncbi:MAG: hypothetical protein WCI11_04735 [Candidatus Methylumidiphilus sp.]
MLNIVFYAQRYIDANIIYNNTKSKCNPFEEQLGLPEDFAQETGLIRQSSRCDGKYGVS